MNSTKLKLIKLTEVIQSASKEGWEEREVLVNAEAVVTAQVYKLERKGEDRLLIGVQQERIVTQIMTVVGTKVAVAQSLDEITAAVVAAVATV